MKTEQEFESLEAKIVDIEKDLLRQEHRPWKLVYNYILRNDKYPKKDDKRRKAITKALIWRVLASPTTITIAFGGFLSFLTIYYLRQQNQLIEQQGYLMEANRRSSQMFIMGEVLSDINKELKEPAIPNKSKLSKTLQGRIISLSRAMKPYRYIENGVLRKNESSPERGQLLITLIQSNTVGGYFEYCDFSYAESNGIEILNQNFESGNLKGADLSGSILGTVNLRRTDLTDANLRNVFIAHDTNIFSAILDGADLQGADLSRLKMTSNMEGLQVIKSMHNVKVSREDWISYIKDSLNLKGSEKIHKEYIVVDSSESHSRVRDFRLIRKKL